jgi:hypothetical protein
MSKKLAIKGHATRGKEVIELLEMMGGKNCYNLNGLFSENAYYFIGGPHKTEIKAGEYIFGDEDMYMHLLTLEEFLDEYPFKIGDKVVDGHGNLLTIKAMSWSEDCETMVYDFEDSVIVLAAEDLLKCNAEFLVNKEKSEEVGKMLCDMTLKHLHGNHLKNVLSELYEHIKTTSKEDLEREFEEIAEWTNVGPTVEEFMTFCECVNKKPKYPKTYEECCKITEDVADASLTCFACNLLNNFQKLLLCRDAYWEIAGEEMGLNEPWKPDWDNGLQKKYAIYPNLTDYVLGSKNKIYVGNTRILVFPTEDMRDVFYENFKDLIEECKELL